MERRKPILKEEERVHKVKIIQSGHQRGNRNIFPSKILVSNLSPSFCCPELPFLPLLKKVRLARISSNTAIDSTPKREPSDTLPITVNLRVREKLCPRDDERKDTMHMQKVSSLHIFLRHVQVQASLVMSPLREIILRPEPSAFQLHTYNRLVGDNLNESQMSALMSVTETMIATRSAHPKIALLQGPPGTGKSHVIVQMILRIIRSGQERKLKLRILVCAPSNAAVDEIAGRLIEERDRTTTSSYLSNSDLLL